MHHKSQNTKPIFSILDVKGIEDLEMLDRGGNMRPTLIGKKNATGRIYHSVFDGITVRQFQVQNGVRLVGEISPDQLVFGTLFQGPGAKYCSQNVHVGDTAVMPAAFEQDASLPSSSEWLITMCDPDRFREIAMQEGLYISDKELSNACLHKARAEQSLGNLRLLRDFALTVQKSPALLSDAKLVRSMTEDVLRMYAHAIADRSNLHDIAKPGSRKNKRLIYETEEILHADISANIGIYEICQALGVSQRTLYRAFNCEFGVSPAAYIRKSRLCKARLELLNLSPKETTVGKIASKFGFWEWGRFAGYYKSAFGELPSVTLSSRARIHNQNLTTEA